MKFATLYQRLAIRNIRSYNLPIAIRINFPRKMADTDGVEFSDVTAPYVFKPISRISMNEWIDG